MVDNKIVIKNNKLVKGERIVLTQRAESIRKWLYTHLQYSIPEMAEYFHIPLVELVERMNEKHPTDQLPDNSEAL